MPADTPSIVVLEDRIAPALLRRLAEAWFGDLVKYVVDVSRGAIAIGGEMHADAEAVLLERGSSHDDLWGANDLPGQGPEGCIEYTSLINIRPARGNRGMEIEDPGVRERIRALTLALIGDGTEA